MAKSDRRKASKSEDGADLISNLPDDILLLILSKLPSTEEIIRTSILSRRWRHLWTSIPSLKLSYHRKWEFSVKSNKSKFKEFVDRVLLNRSVDLDGFSLFAFDWFSMSTVERWIDAAVTRNVKQLDLWFFPKKESEDMVMPHSVVTCASLEVLKLNLSIRGLSLPKVTGFPSLRVLNLKYVGILDDNLVNYFLESCPMLEDLTMEDCMLHKLDLLCISSPKLKKLRIFGSNLCGSLKISCPKLVFLGLTGYFTINLICECLYSLKEAVIMDIHRLLLGISHVESLTTNLHLLYESLDVAACDPGLPNLKTLELTSRRASFTAENLIKILKHCPQLESLCLRVENDSSYEAMGFYGFEKLDVAKTSKLTPDVKWVVAFEINGEKLKIDARRSKRDKEWMCMVATWGKKARCTPIGCKEGTCKRTDITSFFMVNNK